MLFLLGITRHERHRVIAEIGEAISAAGGWIVDHTSFSNIAIAIRFSLPPRGLDEWRRRIEASGVRLDEASLAHLRQAFEDALENDEEMSASLNVTFIHDEPDLRQVVPAVPG